MKKLILALALVTTTSVAGQGMEPPQAPTASTESSATPAKPGLIEDVIKLWKANLSEDFIDKFIATAELTREITAEDVVRLRSAGVPETIILSVTRRKMESAGGPPAGNAAAAGPAAGGAAPFVVPAPAASSRRWDGLVRRNGGIVMLKSRWDAGVLEFKDESLRWVDSRNLGKNVLVPGRQITEQQLTCLKKSGGNECFEWVVKTKSDEFRFRDVGWRQGENAKVAEVFQFFRTLYPALVASQVPVDEK